MCSYCMETCQLNKSVPPPHPNAVLWTVTSAHVVASLSDTSGTEAKLAHDLIPSSTWPSLRTYIVEATPCHQFVSSIQSYPMLKCPCHSQLLTSVPCALSPLSKPEVVPNISGFPPRRLTFGRAPPHVTILHDHGEERRLSYQWASSVGTLFPRSSLLLGTVVARPQKERRVSRSNALWCR